MADLLSLPNLDQLAANLITVTNPIFAIMFFILIFWYLGFFFKLLYKACLAISLIYNLLHDYWIMYNANDLNLDSYKNMKLHFSYGSKGMKEISDQLKEATSLF